MHQDSCMSKIKSPKYLCTMCHFTSNNKKDYNRHVSSAKHNFVSDEIIYKCEFCEKKYKSREGLWRHKKVHQKIVTSDTEMSDLTKLITKVIQHNQDLQLQIAELTKTGIVNNYNPTFHTNTTFNLHFFLNETCKDAMNIRDFIDSINVSVEDLKRVGDRGYVDGISGIIMDHLKNIDITKRPMHCSDVKRETIYIKENNNWEKDSEQKEKLKQIVDEISKINTRSIEKYHYLYPQCIDDIHSKEHVEYGEIIQESFGGKEMDMDIQRCKVIRKLIKNIAIEKTGN